ncbi:beta-L-arabinofuranosidase domain-containing protein [Actinoplanes sp. NPDC024001]|uniref:glycoside hydrolase family 127 protein n=1 Tax=Actinoplanes sp. NPDC024001 TaxID=3154598 RepID=UPI0033DF88E2
MTIETTQTGGPVAPHRSRLRPLSPAQVSITGGFWAELQDRNRRAIIPHIDHWLERAGWLGNFSAAPQDRRGREFSDSEIYKFLEAMAWELGRAPDRALAERYDAIVARVAAAQAPDGYLNTRFGRPGQPPRWSDLAMGHELYCLGHLIQAAVARARTGHPDDLLVRVACRAADLVCATFGDDGIASVDGHPVIEPALVELYRVTGEQRYLEQARLFVERRGRPVLPDDEWGREYYLDDVPVREATVFRGHAVRAVYLAAGALDLADETGDGELLDAVTGQWRRTVARRVYLTGGIGSRHLDEAFGEDFMLPPDRAYSETCAAVGSVMVAWRLLLAHGDPAAADLIERTLYNVIATSPRADGRAFFYSNTLHRRVPGPVPDPDRPHPRPIAAVRAPWFDVSCCPTNVSRTVAGLAGYVATSDDDGIQLHQYVPGTVAGRLTVTTRYPAEGEIRVRIDTDADEEWTLSLRVPAWAGTGATLTVGGHTWEVEPGYVTERRRWRRGDELLLCLPMEPRFTYPDPRIDAVRGCVAVERGPLVYALESVDLPDGVGVDEVRISSATPPRVVGGRVVVRGRRIVAAEGELPYAAGPPRVAGSDLGEIPLVTYHSWANRGPAGMRVWLPAD